MAGEMFVSRRGLLCRDLEQGDVMIADHLSSHQVEGAKEALAEVGAHICVGS